MCGNNFQNFLRLADPMGFQSTRFSWCGGDHPRQCSTSRWGTPGGCSQFPASAAPMAFGIDGRGQGGARVPDAAYRPILRAWRAIGGMVLWIAATRMATGAIT